jgi:hypothetical protein
MDLFARRVLGWQVADHLRSDLALDALEMAIWVRRDEDLGGLVHHSDRGVQYQCRLVNFWECIHTFPQGGARGFCGKLPVFRIAFR